MQWISDKWCFTINAPAGMTKQNALDFLEPICEHIKEIECKCCVFQIECGKNGTYHIQGVIELHKKNTFKQTKELLHPTAHIEKCRDLTASIKYCTKDETRFGSQYIHIADGEYETYDEQAEWSKFMARNPGCWGCNDMWPYCHACADTRVLKETSDFVEREDNI